MEPVEALDYANRRAMWLKQHRQKRNKDDMMNRKLFEKAENENSAWKRQVLGNDLQRFDVDQKWILENAEKRGLIRDTIRLVNKRRNAPLDQQSTQVG